MRRESVQRISSIVHGFVQALSVKFNRWVQGGSCLSFPLVQKGPSTSGHKPTPLDPLGSGGDRGK